MHFCINPKYQDIKQSVLEKRTMHYAQAYLEPSQTSTIEHFAKIIYRKNFILDI